MISPKSFLSLSGYTLLLALGVAGCDLSVDPNHGLQEILGVIGDNAQVDIPDFVRAGAPFHVVVVTRGDDSCYRGGEPRILQVANSVVIEPRDFVQRPSEILGCNSLGNGFTHRARILFATPGAATVVVRGLVRWTRTAPLDTVEVARTVHVQ